MLRSQVFSAHDIPMRTKQNLEDLKFMIRSEFLSHNHRKESNPMGLLAWFEIHTNEPEPFMVKLLGFDDHNRWILLRLYADQDACELALFPSEFVIRQCALLHNTLKSGTSTDAWHTLEHAVISGCDVCSERRLLHMHHKQRVCQECMHVQHGGEQNEEDDDTSSDESDFEFQDSSTVQKDKAVGGVRLTRSMRKSLIPSHQPAIHGNIVECVYDTLSLSYMNVCLIRCCVCVG